MKNKGFTLIELLGVIIILALLMIMVFPSIVNSVKKSSNKTDDLTKQLIYNAADLFIDQHKNEFPKIKDNKYIIELKTLVDEGFLVAPIKLSDSDLDITNSKCIQVTYQDDYKYELKDSGTCKYEINNNLPSEYQQVEYIASTGTQYIDTGLIPSTNLSVEVEMKYIKGTNIYGFNGAYESGKAFQLGLAYVDDNTVRISMNGGFKEPVGKTGLDINSFYTIKLSNGEQYVNDELIDTQVYGALTSNKFLLFGRTSLDNNVVGIQQWNGQIKSFKAWEDGNLIKDFIPCYRKSDNVIGMYDLVNNVFYTNSGTGTFEKGNDV